MSAREEKIITLLSDRLGVNTDEIKPETDITRELGADSIDIVEIIVDIEREFGISVSDSDCEGVSTVGELVACVEKKSSK